MMDEKEFKKLAANNRDWLIYKLLSERSKEIFMEEVSLAELIKNNTEVQRDHIKWHKTPTCRSKVDEGKELNKQLEKLGGEIKSEHVSGVNIEIRGEKAGSDSSSINHPKDVRDGTLNQNSKPPNPKGETTVIETVTGRVVLVTDKAVLIGDGDRVAWFPKSVIENLDKIVLDKEKIVELKIKDWFKYKIEWKVPTQ